MLFLFKIIILIFFLCFFLQSITAIVNPYYIWKLIESWKAIREPSKKYFMIYRVVGVIATLLGLLFLIVFIKAVF